jgi:hypothetical protein
MEAYITLLTLFAFSSIAVSSGLQEVPNVAKVIAYMYKKLPNSCIFIMNSETQEQGKNSFDLILHKW